jgi:probable phosphoglycerate mutase
MQILLARHGNTFAPGEQAVWVGRETDLPLVERGVEQAHAVAAALKGLRLSPTRVFCGTLKRTRRFAEIISEDLATGLAPVADPRLDEIDYGRWAGKSGREIAEDFGQEELLGRWNEADVWPAGAGWGSSEAEILGGVEGFLEDVRTSFGAHDLLLVVSSSGILRFVPRLLGLVAAGGPERSFHMKTGHMGVIEYREGAFELKCWDVSPADIAI